MQTGLWLLETARTTQHKRKIWTEIYVLRRGVLGPFLNTLTQCLCSVPVLPYSRDVLQHTADQRGEGGEEREWKRMGDRGGERDSKVVGGAAVTPAEEGGPGLPGATYKHLDLSTHPADAFVWACAVFMYLRERVHVRLWLLTFWVTAVLLVGVLVLVERELAWKDEVLSTFSLNDCAEREHGANRGLETLSQSCWQNNTTTGAGREGQQLGINQTSKWFLKWANHSY